MTARSLSRRVLAFRPMVEKNPTAPTLFLNAPLPFASAANLRAPSCPCPDALPDPATIAPILVADRTPMSRANDGYGKLGGGPSGGESARTLMLVATYASGRTANVASEVVEPPDTWRG